MADIILGGVAFYVSGAIGGPGSLLGFCLAGIVAARLSLWWGLLVNSFVWLVFTLPYLFPWLGKWPIVAEPGSDVARLRIAITNIKPSRPGVSAVTSVVPVALGVSLVKKGATGGWSGSGDTCIELIALDSTTNEILLLAFDEQKAAFEQRFSKWGSANDAFKFWSEKAVAFIDNYKGVKREPKK